MQFTFEVDKNVHGNPVGAASANAAAGGADGSSMGLLPVKKPDLKEPKVRHGTIEDKIDTVIGTCTTAMRPVTFLSNNDSHTWTFGVENGELSRHGRSN